MKSIVECSTVYPTINTGLISKNAAINLIIGVVLFFCVLLSRLPTSMYCSLISVALFYFFIFAFKPIMYFKYLHFIFRSSIAIVGCAVIELFDVDLWEISDHSAFNGALPLLVFSWWLFLSTIMMIDTWLSNKLENRTDFRTIRIKDSFDGDSKRTDPIVYIAACIGLVLIAFTFVKVLRNPSFVVGVDRFDYSKLFDYGFLYDQANRFIRYLIIACIVVAIYKRSKIGWVALAIYCMHSFWTGNKFGSFFSLFCTCLMIYSKKIESIIEKKKGSIIVIGLLTASLIALSVFAVSFTRDEGASNYLVPRLAQQGQLWWKTYETSTIYHINEFGDEIASSERRSADIKENVGSKYGIYKMMYYTTPKTQVDAKLNSGSRYTEAGFPAAYYYFGIPGCISFAVIGGFLTSVFVNYFLYYLRFNQFIRAFIHLRLYTNMTVLMSMFIFSPYFNKTSIVSYLILLIGHNKIFTYGKEQI